MNYMTINIYLIHTHNGIQDILKVKKNNNIK